MFELAPTPKQQFLDANGAPLNGGFLYAYAAGTTTPLATYTDSTGNTANTNPIILDSSGRCDIWLGSNLYKFKLTDSLGNQIWVVDNVQSTAAQIAAISSTIQSVTISYTQLQAAATSKNVSLFTLPAKSILKEVIIKHATAFTGTGLTDVYAQVGLSGTYNDFIEQFSVLQAVGTTVFDNVIANYIGDFTSTTVVYLNAVSSGANLSALTQGSVTVWYRYDTFT